MPDKNNQKPWENSFDEELNTSRVKLQKHKRHSQQLIQIGCMIVFVLFMFFAIKSSVDQSNQVSESNSSTSMFVEITTHKPGVKRSSQTAVTHASSTDEVTKPTKAPAAENSSESSMSSSSSEESHDEAILQPTAGQGLYSWALAHGTTAENIYTLNPGLTANNWSSFVGQSIRIS